MLKPLLFWVGAGEEPFASDNTIWRLLAEHAVTHSDSDATAELWAQVGEARLLGPLADRTGVAWTTDTGGEDPALRVMVTAGELAVAYAPFASDGNRSGTVGSTFEPRRRRAGVGFGIRAGAPSAGVRFVLYDLIVVGGDDCESWRARRMQGVNAIVRGESAVLVLYLALSRTSEAADLAMAETTGSGRK